MAPMDRRIALHPRYATAMEIPDGVSGIAEPL
jgi:hypothetical protein